VPSARRTTLHLHGISCAARLTLRESCENTRNGIGTRVRRPGTTADGIGTRVCGAGTRENGIGTAYIAAEHVKIASRHSGETMNTRK
jgi:hypothetical protein